MRVQAHALRQNTVQRLFMSVAHRSLALRGRDEHSPQSILLRIQLMKAASLSCSDLAGLEGQQGAPPERGSGGSARQGRGGALAGVAEQSSGDSVSQARGRALAEAKEGSYGASVLGPPELQQQAAVMGSFPGTEYAEPTSRYNIQASALQQQQQATPWDGVEAPTLQQQQQATTRNGVEAAPLQQQVPATSRDGEDAPPQQQVPAWVKSGTPHVSVQEFGSYVAQYLPHASPREQALLGWQFRLHMLVASSGWRTFMMLCVAGSIGMLASETSFMDQATLWRMVQANWVLTGFFFVDVALRLLSSLRPVDIFRSGPDCFQVRRGTLRGENTSAALLRSVCWHTSSRSSYLHRASPGGGKMQPKFTFLSHFPGRHACTGHRRVDHGGPGGRLRCAVSVVEGSQGWEPVEGLGSAMSVLQ